MTARSRLATCFVLGLLAFIAILFPANWQVAALTGWDVTSASFIAIVFFALHGKDSGATRREAHENLMNPSP